MYPNTTYKAFVAETAAKIAAELSASRLEDRLLEEEVAREISQAAINVAEKLAEELEDWWSAEGEHQTVMFDVADSLTSNIENELGGIADKLESIGTQIKRGLNVNVIDEE